DSAAFEKACSSPSGKSKNLGLRKVYLRCQTRPPNELGTRRRDRCYGRGTSSVPALRQSSRAKAGQGFEKSLRQHFRLQLPKHPTDYARGSSSLQLPPHK